MLKSDILSSLHDTVVSGSTNLFPGHWYRSEPYPAVYDPSKFEVLCRRHGGRVGRRPTVRLYPHPVPGRLYQGLRQAIEAMLRVSLPPSDQYQV